MRAVGAGTGRGVMKTGRERSLMNKGAGNTKKKQTREVAAYRRR